MVFQTPSVPGIALRYYIYYLRYPQWVHTYFNLSLIFFKLIIKIINSFQSLLIATHQVSTQLNPGRRMQVSTQELNSVLTAEMCDQSPDLGLKSILCGTNGLENF